MSLFKWIDIRTIGDERGQLCVIEQDKDLPFQVKRFYYLTNLDYETPRGFHAHRSLRQIAICIAGSCEMIFDDGNRKESIVMNSSSKGLLIEPYIWHEMHNFSKDCVFMVLASDYYNELDYIRDYSEFKGEGNA